MQGSKTGQSSGEFTRAALPAGALGSGRKTGRKNGDKIWELAFLKPFCPGGLRPPQEKNSKGKGKFLLEVKILGINTKQQRDLRCLHSKETYAAFTGRMFVALS